MKTDPPRPSLPTPDEYPDADVVIYDGDCVFCTRQIRTLARLDGRHRLAFLSLHDKRVAERYPDLTHEQMMEQMYVIPSSPKGGQPRFGGAAALRYLSRRLPRLWVLAPLLHIPFSLPFWRWGYRQIARQRYRIANRDQPCSSGGTCHLHHHDD